MRHRTLRMLSLVSCLLVAAVCLALQPASAQIVSLLEHTPVNRGLQGKPVHLEVRLRSAGRIPVYVRVYFRRLSETQYRHIELRRTPNGYEGEIPAQYVKPPVIQYFILALFPEQRVESLPELNPYGQPYEISIESASTLREVTPEPERRALAGGSLPKPDSAGIASILAAIDTTRFSGTVMAQIISPEPFEVVNPEEILIAASFIGNAQGVDSSSIRLSLDGEDVTYLADISPFLVTLTPEALIPGEHTVMVWANDLQGKPVQPISWRFTVTAKHLVDIDEGERNFDARVYGEIRQEKFSGQTLDIKNLGGSLNGIAGPFQYDGTFLITSLEDPHFQPRNRYSLNIRSKVLELGFGDAYPYFNELVMWGRRVRGFSGALKLGLINVQVATGQTNRRVPPIYTTSEGTPVLVARGMYRQNLLAARLSFGGGRTFQLGLMALKAKDDVNSLKPGEAISTPRDNLVAGGDFLLSLNNHRIEIKGSVAFSLITNDITNGPATKAEIDSTFDINIPFDPASLKDILILNESTVPLDPTGLTSLAYEASVNLNYFGHFFSAGYRRIGPQYNSLGLTYLRGNVRGFFVNDRVGLFGNRVYASVGFESYLDNFGREDDNPAIDQTTVNFSLAVFPGPGLPVLNIALKNYVRDNGVDRLFFETGALGRIDTTDLREQSLTRDLSLNLNYGFNALNLRHDATLSVISSRLIDDYSNTRPTTAPSLDYETTVQMLSLKTDYQMPLTTTLNFATNRNETTRGLSVIKFDMLGGRADYRLLNDKMTVYGGVRYIKAGGTQRSATGVALATINYKQTSFQLGLSYQPNSQHAFLADLELINLNDQGGVLDPVAGFVKNPSFKNHVFRIFYEFRL